ncbi:ABC transporter permease [Achromobacter sp. NPDC058515]|uniref:ABC transporter permease n=1 Tax=Achromobacter sp. NPDC058515 TaxID=3346533 RepID=UPI00364B397C
MFKLAWRNLLRNRRRTGATLLAMIVGMVGILLFGGYAVTIERGLQTAFVRSMGHMQIQHKDYLLYGSGNPSLYGIYDYEKIRSRIQSHAELQNDISVITPVLTAGGIAGRYATGASKAVMVQGVEVEGQSKLRSWNAYGMKMRVLPNYLDGMAQNSAVLGGGVARVLGICAQDESSSCALPTLDTPQGEALAQDIASLSHMERPAEAGEDQIELLTATAAGVPNIARLQVVGIEKQGARELDDIYVGVHLPQAQNLLNGGDGQVATAVLVQLYDTARLPYVKAKIQAILREEMPGQPLIAHDFMTLQPLYERIITMFEMIFGFIALLIACVAIFTIGNTMNMAVMERTVEIGTLRSMGLRRGGVQSLFLCEGAMLGAIGCVLGIGMAWIAAGIINRAELAWLPPGVVYPSPIHIQLWAEPKFIMVCVGVLILVSLLSTWFPAQRAARISIVDSLRYV